MRRFIALVVVHGLFLQQAPASDLKFLPISEIRLTSKHFSFEVTASGEEKLDALRITWKGVEFNATNFQLEGIEHPYFREIRILARGEGSDEINITRKSVIIELPYGDPVSMPRVRGEKKSVVRSVCRFYLGVRDNMFEMRSIPKEGESPFWTSLGQAEAEEKWEKTGEGEYSGF